MEPNASRSFEQIVRDISPELRAVAGSHEPLPTAGAGHDEAAQKILAIKNTLAKGDASADTTTSSDYPHNLPATTLAEVDQIITFAASHSLAETVKKIEQLPDWLSRDAARDALAQALANHL